MFKVIIYDDEVMGCYEAENIVFDYKEIPIEITTLEDTVRKYIDGIPEYCIYGSGNIKRMVELDPTTMKKIAKYNKEVELENIQREIKFKKDELKALEEEIKDRQDRISKIHELVEKIYDDDEDEDYDEYWV